MQIDWHNRQVHLMGGFEFVFDAVWNVKQNSLEMITDRKQKNDPSKLFDRNMSDWFTSSVSIATGHLQRLAWRVIVSTPDVERSTAGSGSREVRTTVFKRLGSLEGKKKTKKKLSAFQNSRWGEKKKTQV